MLKCLDWMLAVVIRLCIITCKNRWGSICIRSGCRPHQSSRVRGSGETRIPPQPNRLIMIRTTFTSADIVGCLCYNPEFTTWCNTCEFSENESFIERWDFLFGGRPDNVVTPGLYLYSYGKVLGNARDEFVPTITGKDMEGCDIYLYRL